MFCCTKRQKHYGQIVNAVCLQQNCIQSKNQLSCPVCIDQQHKGHSLSTMKNILPDLLNAHKQKQKIFSQLGTMLEYVVENFGDQNVNGENVTMENVISRAMEIMGDLKNQVAANNQQISKMKDIFKNINKNANQVQVPVTKSVLMSDNKNSQQKFSPLKSSLGFTSNGPPVKGSSKFTVSSPMGKSGMLKSANHNVIGTIDTFSHNLKHPYLALSPDCRTVTKNSHPGHRYAVLNSKSLLPDENQVHIKIDTSPSGNIMIGLCHQSIVKQKQFVNNYGTGHGTYLIGQNGNNQKTAISFHHSINMMNRKQIVGWNFSQGDSIVVGFNFNQEYVYFKVHKNKGKVMEFSMALLSQDASNKELVRNMVVENGLKIVVLLQNVGDQVTLLQM